MSDRAIFDQFRSSLFIIEQNQKRPKKDSLSVSFLSLHHRAEPKKTEKRLSELAQVCVLCNRLVGYEWARHNRGKNRHCNQFIDKEAIEVTDSVVKVPKKKAKPKSKAK